MKKKDVLIHKKADITIKNQKRRCIVGMKTKKEDFKVRETNRIVMMNI